MAGQQRLRLGLVEGDGIGPEVVGSARRVVDEALNAAAASAVEWVALPMGHRALSEFGSPLPQSTLDALDGTDGWILGPHDNASYPSEHRTAPGGAVRRYFGLHANIRPVHALPGMRAMAPDIDLVIVRENSEGFYADRNMAAGSGEFCPTPDLALSVGKVSRAACERIAHEAFRLAGTRRGRVTIVHKANALPLTMGLFRDTCYKVARDYPEITVHDEHVDAAAAHLVRAAADFDVVVTENLFGDILSDLAAQLGGSLGTAASLNCSDTRAMAQAVHGAAPDLAGRDRADPVAAHLSAAMLLRWLANRYDRPAVAEAADRIERAVAAVLAAGVATADLGGQASTGEFTEQVTAHIHHR